MTLLDHARAVRENAHAPYSGFPVGAAVKSASGRVYIGCNVENASYPEGSCAETGAIAAMVAAGEVTLVEVAIVADSDHPITPCGGCRQRLAEFGRGDTRVIMATLDGVQRESTLACLLPGAFARHDLSRG
ncbi:MAG: cytidine deaminase [Roseovarius sp.]|jgi:cytidine deaminase|nr:cytidine deaminase [Roseovarius sp.]